MATSCRPPLLPPPTPVHSVTQSSSGLPVSCAQVALYEEHTARTDEVWLYFSTSHSVREDFHESFHHQLSSSVKVEQLPLNRSAAFTSHWVTGSLRFPSYWTLIVTTIKPSRQPLSARFVSSVSQCSHAQVCVSDCKHTDTVYMSPSNCLITTNR